MPGLGGGDSLHLACQPATLGKYPNPAECQLRRICCSARPVNISHHSNRFGPNAPRSVNTFVAW